MAAATYVTGIRWPFVNTSATTVTHNYTWNTSSTATSTLWASNQPKVPRKIKSGKYQVRCRGCSRWAKIIEEKTVFGFPQWRVYCERCLGENEGFA